VLESAIIENEKTVMEKRLIEITKAAYEAAFEM